MTTRTPAIRQTVGEARPGGVTEAPVAVPGRTAADVLRSAARYIEEHGWYSRGLAEPFDNDPVCIYVAIGRVENEPLNRFAAYDALWAVIGTRHTTDALFRWNDTPGRTEAEVLEALRLAAAAADGSAS